MICLLRGINVSGHKPIKMEALRAAFETRGFGDVRTYLQSGNVLFDASGASPANLKTEIEDLILKEFGFKVPVLIRTSAELKRIMGRNPFLKTKGIDLSRVGVVFLSGSPNKTALKGLEALVGKNERFHSEGREIYLHCPDGFGRSKLSNAAIEKKLSLVATSRNWNTVSELFSMAT